MERISFCFLATFTFPKSSDNRLIAGRCRLWRRSLARRSQINAWGDDDNGDVDDYVILWRGMTWIMTSQHTSRTQPTWHVVVCAVPPAFGRFFCRNFHGDRPNSRTTPPGHNAPSLLLYVHQLGSEPRLVGRVGWGENSPDAAKGVLRPRGFYSAVLTSYQLSYTWETVEPRSVRWRIAIDIPLTCCGTDQSIAGDVLTQNVKFLLDDGRHRRGCHCRKIWNRNLTTKMQRLLSQVGTDSTCRPNPCGSRSQSQKGPLWQCRPGLSSLRSSSAYYAAQRRGVVSSETQHHPCYHLQRSITLTPWGNTR